MAEDGAKVFLDSKELGMPHRSVYFVVSLQVNDGRLDTFRQIAQAMIAATQKEPGALAYEWHLSSDNKRCRLLEIYADQAAVQAHIDGEAVKHIPKLLENASLTGFEVYGDTGPAAGQTLKGIGAEFFAYWHGLAS
jgi:quinol monooxygenase YgiN